MQSAVSPLSICDLWGDHGGLYLFCDMLAFWVDLCGSGVKDMPEALKFPSNF